MMLPTLIDRAFISLMREKDNADEEEGERERKM